MNISLENAVSILTKIVSAVRETEQLPIIETVGCVTAEDVYAINDQPPFDRSPLDGFAMNHKDTDTSSNLSPVNLKVIATIHAGEHIEKPLNKGEAVRIMTGAPFPQGATCVVRQENVKYENGVVSITKPMKKHQNYCFKGEDIQAGCPVLMRGERIGSAHTGIIAGQGFSQLLVFQRPRVGILSTGSELAPPGKPLPVGKIYDSNGILLASRVREAGGEPVLLDGGLDQPDHLRTIIEKALPYIDLLVTTGGVSNGEYDFIPQVGQALGAKQIFRGVAMKPGGWATAYGINGKIMLCLSGNPFAAAASFELLAIPVIRRLAGELQTTQQYDQGILQTAYPKSSPGRRFVRGHVKGANIFLPQIGHDSGSLSSFSSCNCLVDIPADTPPLKQGDCVSYIPLYHTAMGTNK